MLQKNKHEKALRFHLLVQTDDDETVTDSALQKYVVIV